MSPEPTPSQTIGPFFHDALLAEGGSRLVPADHPAAIRIEGTVVDGAGGAVPDAMIEIWQANSLGRYNHPKDDREEVPLEDGFTGFGRSGTDAAGRFAFTTVKPGAVPASGGAPDGRTQAPHVLVSVFARGLLKRLATRIYFPDEAEANASDQVLSSIEDPRMRETLIAGDEGDSIFHFDIRLQGEDQTAFFDV